MHLQKKTSKLSLLKLIKLSIIQEEPFNMIILSIISMSGVYFTMFTLNYYFHLMYFIQITLFYELQDHNIYVYFI